MPTWFKFPQIPQLTMNDKWLYCFLIIVSLLFLTGAILEAQTPGPLKVMEVKAQKVQTTKRENQKVNEKLTSDDIYENTNHEVEEGKSKGVSCEINFENRTGFMVEVYIDGKHKGTLSAYGDAVYRNLSGYRDIYCVTRNRQYEWITKGNCDGNYKYRLNRETAE